VTTALEVDGLCRMIADSGLVCWRSAVDAAAVAAGDRRSSLASDADRRLGPLVTGTVDDRRPLPSAGAGRRLRPLVTGAADDRRPLSLPDAGDMSATSSEA